MSSRDVFLSHAAEDKDAVVRPLATALKARGWSVWLDELELEIGDSLHRRIDEALARSRFGVVVLSPAFLAKEWTRQELAALAAREVSTGTKVILPVWHNIDHAELAAVSPLMADRLGARTALGVDDVADRLSRALGKALAATDQEAASLLVRSVPDAKSDDMSPLSLPLTAGARAAVASARPPHWELLLFAGELRSGSDALVSKWYDHELRQGGGERRTVSEAAALSSLLSNEMAWVGQQIEALNRVMDPENTAKAFGAPGEPGDPHRVSHLAQSILRIYEALLDWAAGLRNVTAPDVFDEVIEATAAFCDGPINGARKFIDETADGVTNLPAAMAITPGQLTLTLDLDVAPVEGASERVRKATRKARRRLRWGF
jgi:TIR domain